MILVGLFQPAREPPRRGVPYELGRQEGPLPVNFRGNIVPVTLGLPAGAPSFSAQQDLGADIRNHLLSDAAHCGGGEKLASPAKMNSQE